MQAPHSEQPGSAPRTFLSSRVRRPTVGTKSLQVALDVVRGWLEAARLHAAAHEKDLETYALLPDDSMKADADMIAWRLDCIRERIEELEAVQADIEHEYLGLVVPQEHAQA